MDINSGISYGVKKIKINLTRKDSYDILVGFNCLKTLGTLIKRLKLGDNIFIITSPRIGGLYLGALKAVLKKANFESVKVKYLPDGEKNKVFSKLAPFYRELAEFDVVNKKLLIINLGGGVIGDFGGFVASSYRRGVNYIQIPTTLLACVDSGIGGKVGVDFERLKNYIGFFYQPKLVFTDLSMLETLNMRERRAGFAEIIKYGVISDLGLFQIIEKNHDKIINLNKKLIETVVDKSYRIKAKIVEQDERDTKGIRAALNYGHTIGHAVEASSNYAYRHGEAIAIGMACADDIAVKLRLLKAKDAERIERLIKNVKLPTRIKNCRPNNILEKLSKDKKFINGKNRFILPVKIGKVIIREGIDNNLIRQVIKTRFQK